MKLKPHLRERLWRTKREMGHNVRSIPKAAGSETSTKFSLSLLRTDDKKDEN